MNTNYFEMPNKAPRTEEQTRWLSWQVLSDPRRRALQLFGVKGTYQGTVPAKTIAKRRAKNRVAKQTRKANRGK